MKKIVCLLYFISLSTLFSCNQDIEYPYQGKDRIHFDHYTEDYKLSRIYFTEKVVSFGLSPEDVTTDTLKVVVRLLGRVSNVDRKYRVIVNQDSTTAKESEHYNKFDEEQIFHAGKIVDTMKICINRGKLNTSFREKIDHILYLEIRENSDFDLGLKGGHQMKFRLNNYLTEPVWWKSNFLGRLEYYHPEKWKVLIGFNNVFANSEKVPFGANTSIGQQYIRGLRIYLDANVVLDSETGERVKMDKLEPIN